MVGPNKFPFELFLEFITRTKQLLLRKSQWLWDVNRIESSKARFCVPPKSRFSLLTSLVSVTAFSLLPGICLNNSLYLADMKSSKFLFNGKQFRPLRSYFFLQDFLNIFYRRHNKISQDAHTTRNWRKLAKVYKAWQTAMAPYANLRDTNCDYLLVGTWKTISWKTYLRIFSTTIPSCRRCE